LIRTELAPYQDSGPDTLTGPRVVLRPALAQSLSLVLHELSTNAVKHGALSRPEGRVMVTWHIEGVRAKAGAMELVIEWRERGVAVPREIGPEGFGTSTIRDLLKYEAGAEVLLAFPASGAECTIRLPVVAGDITLL
jgi:two-component sensor histidine kinase